MPHLCSKPHHGPNPCSPNLAAAHAATAQVHWQAGRAGTGMSLALGCRAEGFRVPGCRSHSVVLNATCAGWGRREPGDSRLPSQSRRPPQSWLLPLLPPSLLPSYSCFPFCRVGTSRVSGPAFSSSSPSRPSPGEGPELCPDPLSCSARERLRVRCAQEKEETDALPFPLSPRAARRHCRTLGFTWNCIRGRHRYFKMPSGRPIHAVAVINLHVCTDWSVRVPKGF